MRYGFPVVRGILLRRYKRFLADVELAGGGVVTVHCPNSGTMLTCAEPGRPVLLTDRSAVPTRTLRYTWEALHTGRTWIVVNTAIPNAVVAEAIAAGQVPELARYETLRREVAYGREGSRVDIVLEGAAVPRCFVEVKNATMRVGAGALFPDAVTERGARHLRELARAARRGERAVIFFFVGRGDCGFVGPAVHVDPEYARALSRALRAGVEALAYRARATPAGVTLGPRLPVRA